MAGSVIYVIAPNRLVLDSQFEAAQTDALERELPFAVVTCVPAADYSTKFAQLKVLESVLAPMNIPLMVLVGEEAVVLASIVKHAKPAKVYGQSVSSEVTGVDVRSHPHKWPGIVIKTEELKKLVDKNEHMC